MSDDELVSQVCRDERLTLYNFLRGHLCDFQRTDSSLLESESGTLFTTLNQERIKDLINNEYQHYFQRKQKLNIYATKLMRTEAFINDLRTKIDIKTV